jgi:negative regulator of sigma E activity
MDGELSPETSLFMARRLGSNRELGETWARYHLIRACLREPGQQRSLTAIRVDLEGDGALASAGALAGGTAAVQVSRRGAASASRPGRVQPRWLRAGLLRPVGGAAIAASVAVVALVAVVGGPGLEESASPTAAQPFAAPTSLSPESVLRAPLAQPVAQSRMRTYLLLHNQAATDAGRRGSISPLPLTSPAAVKVPDSDMASETGSANAETDSAARGPGDR